MSEFNKVYDKMDELETEIVNVKKSLDDFTIGIQSGFEKLEMILERNTRMLEALLLNETSSRVNRVKQII